jgi:hypothetical protein
VLTAASSACTPPHCHQHSVQIIHATYPRTDSASICDLFTTLAVTQNCTQPTIERRQYSNQATGWTPKESWFHYQHGQQYIHNIDTSNKHLLHRPNANLTCFQKSIFYAGIRIFNKLPLSLISPKNEKTKFKVALRKYLNTHSFYSVDDFFIYKEGS